MASNDLYFELSQGNLIRRTIQVRQFGKSSAWDLSAATQILLEWENGNTDEAQTPIVLDSGVGEADWENGILVLEFSEDDVTAEVGSHQFSVTAYIDGQTPTIAKGVADVQERPGYPHPA